MPQQTRSRRGALSGLLGFVGLSAAAGVLATAAVTPALAVTGMTANNAIGVFDQLPEFLEIGQPMERSNVYLTKADGTDQLLASFYDQNREEVGWDDVSQHLKDAAVATEDPRYYDHGGIDLMGTTRAILTTYVVGGDTQGGSSITQQYVKNVLVQQCEIRSESDEELAACADDATTASGTDGMTRKLKEMRYAIGVEKEYSKDEILLGYLNLANFGSTNYGVEAASRYYFDKSAKDVNIQEAATLVAIVNNPNGLRIDNDANEANNADNEFAQTKIRRDYVINNMLAEGKITQEQHDEAVDAAVEPSITQPSTGCYTAGGSAYFCDYVTKVIQHDEAFGETEEERLALLRRGGLDIYTTLDLDMQLNAERAMSDYVAPGNPNTFDDNHAPAGKVGAAASTVEPGTGRVLSMVQNTRYTAGESDNPEFTSLNYNTDQQHGGSTGFQVGSTYKVFTLVDWLKQGKSLNERIPDAGNRNPANWTDRCHGGSYTQPYPVQNFDQQYSNSVTPLQATRSSINTAFMAMGEQLDLCDIQETAMDFGVERADGRELDKYPSSILGSNEIAPLNMAAAIAALGAEGRFCEPKAIDRIVGADGEEIDLPKQDCHQAVSEDVANTANFAMQSIFDGGGTAAQASVSGAEVFGKTGTSDNARASWITGGTSKAVTSLWIGAVEGNASMYNTYFNQTSGHLSKLGMWRQIMQQAIDERGGDNFAGPTNTLTQTPQTSVPSVTGQSVDDARSALQGAGFQVSVGDEVSSDVSEGDVASTSPGGGATAPTGSTVTISPSSGPEDEVDVPDVTGDLLTDARDALSSAGLSVTTRCVEADDAPGEGRVDGQSPSAGDTVAEGDSVNLRVERTSCD